MNRSQAAQVATETVAIAHAGSYVVPSGRHVEIKDDVQASIAGTEVIRPADWSGVRRMAESLADSRLAKTPRIEVTPETTLAAARRLLNAGAADVFALNFASARNAGGGFLGGSRAQEESLARSSALYLSLLAAPHYYEANHRAKTTIYTDHAIYSPRVPVFRSDDGTLLDEPYAVTFLTMPAVNVSALRQHGRADVLQHEVEETMRRRVGQVLSCAIARGHEWLVLGAWGCGVFGNDPRLIASLFAEALTTPVGRCFEQVTFAVYDPKPGSECFAAFEETFGAVDGRTP